MSAQPSISIIIPTFRRPTALRETLKRLLALDYPRERVELIVVDDGSNDGSAEIAKECLSGSANGRVVTQENRGVASARNHGARVACGEILLFNDDDILVERDCAGRHVQNISRHGRCIVNGQWEFEPSLERELRSTPFGRFRLEVEEWVKSGITKSPFDGDLLEPEGVTACNMGLRRVDFLELGGFDEDFPHAGAEDQEFSLRAKRAGFRFAYDPRIRLLHNDHRLTLRQFCERQRRGALTVAILARKHPEERRDHPLVLENGPIKRGDPLGRIAKKLAKSLLSTQPALSMLHFIVFVLERVSPEARLLRRLYWTACGLYIFSGFRAGLVFSLAGGSWRK